jgi:hypothetical protein
MGALNGRATVLSSIAFLFVGAPWAAPAGADIQVFIYADGTGSEPWGERAVLNAIDGITAFATTSVAVINPITLANYDVFYAATSFHNSLDVKADVLQDFLYNGGAIVVGQANSPGSINWLPPGLQASVADISYPSGGFFALTDAGQTHPIFDGLQTDDFGDNPADTIYADSLGPGWEVLMVHSSDPEMVGMAAGSYGAGRILLWPDRYDSNISVNPSPEFIYQAYHWVSIPAPPALAVIVLGALTARPRRGRRT